MTLKHGHGSSSAGLGRALSALTARPAVTAVANVTPPVAASSCTSPTEFSYSGSLSVSVPGKVTYQWVYSSGRLGPVQSVWFAHPGHAIVAGRTIAPRRAGGGWAELKVLSPAGATSNQAAYQLLCGSGSARGISAAAAVTPATQTAACTSAPPDFTANGTIRAARAETVTYYWAQSDGQDSAPATVTFPGAGTRAVAPLSITPAAASGTGEAVLVVTSPLTAASRPATYTLNCKALPAPPGGSTPTAPGGSGAPTAPATGPSGTPASGPSDSPSASTSDSPASGPSDSPSSPSASPSASTSTPSSSPSCPSGWLGPCTPVSSPTSTPTFSSTIPMDASATLKRTEAGDPYSSSVADNPAGGSGRFDLTATGLPSGLTATAGGSEVDITGVPEVPGTYTVTLALTEELTPFRSGSVTFTLTVYAATLTASVGATSAGTVGQSYSDTVVGVGGYGTFSWSSVKNLPAGLTASTGNFGRSLIISGTPAGPGTVVISGTVSDGESPAQTASWSVTLAVSPAS